MPGAVEEVATARVTDEQWAFDERNFMRRTVNRALRNIGKHNARAPRFRAQGSKAARWISAGALRELPAVAR